MLNAVEVGSQIKIDDSFLPFHDRLVDLQHRFMSCPLWSVSIRPRLKISFKDRLQDELECPLDHTVTNGRNGKNADSGAPVFRNFLFPHPHGLIRLVDQFVLDLFQKTLHSAFLNGIKRHPVDSRGSVITLSRLIGFVKGFHLADVNV